MAAPSFKQGRMTATSSNGCTKPRNIADLTSVAYEAGVFQSGKRLQDPLEDLEEPLEDLEEEVKLVGSGGHGRTFEDLHRHNIGGKPAEEPGHVRRQKNMKVYAVVHRDEPFCLLDRGGALHPEHVGSPFEEGLVIPLR